MRPELPSALPRVGPRLWSPEQDTGAPLREVPAQLYAGVTIRLYETGPAVKLGTSRLMSTRAGLTDPRIVDVIEQRSFLYGLLSEEGQGWMGGCAGGPIRYGVVKRPAG